jgi:hypothetical protein
MAQKPKPKTIARTPTDKDVAPILEAISDGQSLRAICREMGIHHGKASGLLHSTPELEAQYVRAKRDRAEVYAEHVLTAAQAALTGKIKPDAARVAIDAFKWAAGKMDPKRYGDKIQTEHSGGITINLTPDDQGF